MTKRFRVHVKHNDGRQGIEIRHVVNIPDFGNDAEATEEFVRKEWAKTFPSEQYVSIDILGDDEPTAPRPGQFPSGFQLPE